MLLFEILQSFISDFNFINLSREIVSFQLTNSAAINFINLLFHHRVLKCDKALTPWFHYNPHLNRLEESHLLERASTSIASC